MASASAVVTAGSVTSTASASDPTVAPVPRRSSAPSSARSSPRRPAARPSWPAITPPSPPPAATVICALTGSRSTDLDERADGSSDRGLVDRAACRRRCRSPGRSSATMRSSPARSRAAPRPRRRRASRASAPRRCRRPRRRRLGVGGGDLGRHDRRRQLERHVGGIGGVEGGGERGPDGIGLDDQCRPRTGVTSNVGAIGHDGGVDRRAC